MRDRLLRHEVGRERVGGRIHEGPADPQHHKNAENRGDVARVGQREQQQSERAERLQRQAPCHDEAAVEAVGGKPRHQHQQQGRQELRQANVAEIQRIARDVINLPAHRDRHDLHGKRCAADGDPIEDEFGMPQRIGLGGGAKSVHGVCLEDHNVRCTHKALPVTADRYRFGHDVTEHVRTI